MTTQEQLQQVFADNFVAYYRSHVAHVNTQGRNFYSDHKLLGKIYEDLQEQTDSIAELLRSLGEFMPPSLAQVMGITQITDTEVEGDSDDLLALVRADLEELKTCNEDLMEIAETDGHKEIANYAQDRILQLAKYIWMLDSTLD
jgi:starvation-inducible DNA-binding protein